MAWGGVGGGNEDVFRCANTDKRLTEDKGQVDRRGGGDERSRRSVHNSSLLTHHNLWFIWRRASSQVAISTSPSLHSCAHLHTRNRNGKRPPGLKMDVRVSGDLRQGLILVQLLWLYTHWPQQNRHASTILQNDVVRHCQRCIHRTINVLLLFFKWPCSFVFVFFNSNQVFVSPVIISDALISKPVSACTDTTSPAWHTPSEEESCNHVSGDTVL